jgi:hypothetical protein
MPAKEIAAESVKDKSIRLGHIKNIQQKLCIFEPKLKLSD